MNEEKQPTIPLVNLNVSPAGLTITIALSPTTALTQMLPPDALDELMVRWRQVKQEMLKEQEIIQTVMRGRKN
jgi:hypothetical protein